MPSESTPLIQTVHVGPPRRRYPHDTCRRFFTIASLTILVWGFITFAIHAFFIWPYEHYHGRHGSHSGTKPGEDHLSFDELETILLDTPSADLTREWFKYYTSGPHLAGKNLSQAEWTRDKWEGWGIPSSLAAYECYINYPAGASLSLLKQKRSNHFETLFEASLQEDVLEEDPTTGFENRIPTFHGYSANGNVTGSLVYVNYGTYQDYQDLVDAGVPLEGKIAIAKYGGVFRGLKVKRAQELGMVGTLIYSDPGDDGEITEENGYKTYPNGPARQPSSVQRGSVQFLSVRPGDPTTPGYPSKPGVPRAPADSSTPSIPSIPISHVDALPLLKALNGHGMKATDMNKWWNRNNGLRYKGVEYNIGPTPDDVVVNLYNNQDYTITPLWDVIGIVNGTDPNEVVIIGNHRDAWIVGGADPNSGSAILNELVRSVGKALDAGWKPLRTIVFASWDGEEYGLVGSTEWVEEYLPWLQDANVAYVNIDTGVAGPNFNAGATPSLNKILRDVTHRVQSPNQTVPGQTVGDLWSGRIATMGSGSDYTAFQDYAGIPSMTLGFTQREEDPIYHYHSNYDSFYWMDKFGDPGFTYHVTMAHIFGLLLADLVESAILPYNIREYSDELGGYLKFVDEKLDSKRPRSEPTSEEEIFAVRASVLSDEVKGSADTLRESLRAVKKAHTEFAEKAYRLQDLAEWANKELEHGIPWWNVVKQVKVAKAVVNVNNKFKYLERYFLYEGGLDGRDWFKHVIYAPGIWTGYSGVVFPGLVESIDARDYMNGLKWAGIIERCFKNAAKSLS